MNIRWTSPAVSGRAICWLLVAIIAALGAMAVSAPAALAEPAVPDTNAIITLPWPNPAMKPIPPSFVLPRQTRWGCLACHSNPTLSMLRDGEERSLFIDPNIIGNSMHKKIACLDCHTNFSYDEHPASTPQDFRKVAGLACMRCHEFQALIYKNSIHGKLALNDKKGKIAGKRLEAAICADCHGSHDIQSPRFEPGRSKFKAGAKDTCGKCHTDRYESYNDYYHGRAYKAKAKDAPACWDCHNYHGVVKRDDAASTIRPENLPQTCDKCHDRPTAGFTSYGNLIHGRRDALEANPIMKIVRVFIPASSDKDRDRELARERAAIETETPGEGDEGLLQRIIRFFFPRSLRPESRS